MPPINLLNGASGIEGGRGGERLEVFSVEVPGLKPSRREVADSVFRHFGFTRDDMPFLKRHYHGVDPFAYFARELKYDPRSTYTAEDGRTMMRVSLNAKDYEMMQKLAAMHHPQAATTTTQIIAPNPREAVQTKQVFDQSALLKAKVQQQADAQPQNNNAEGVGSFLEGAVAGDFSANDSWSKTGGQIVGGLIPIYGQLADARDTTAALRDVSDGKAGSGVALAAAIVGWVPVVGDSAKAAIKAGRKVLKESAEEVAERAVRENAATLARIADPQARTAAEQAIKSEALIKYEARELTVAKQMDELAVQGHGPQRHGSQITELQLDERAMYGFDPVTGTRQDAYNELPDGTPAPHTPTKHATKVMTDEAYVQAERFIRNSQKYKDEIAEAEKVGRDFVALKGVLPLEDIFGVNYQQHVFGKTRVGSEKNPVGTVATDLTDGTMRAVFRKDAAGNWNLHTMFPEPKK